MSPSIRSRSPLSLLAGAIALAALIAAASPAHADRTKAKEFYDQAEKQYNLGKFDSAVDLYTKAYEEWPEPGFLFNIAQAYRQAGNCKQALFFYKRFLSLKAADQTKPIAPSLRQEVEARIAELEECTKRELANKPPDGQMSPDGGQSTAPSTTASTPPTTVATTATVDGEEVDPDVTASQALYTQPKIVSLRAAGGGAKLFIPGVKESGGAGLTPVQGAFALTAGYPIGIAPQLTVEVGAHFNFMVIPQEVMQKTEQATQLAFLPNAALTLGVSDKIGIRADLGAGILRFAGLKADTPFTKGIETTEFKSSVTMFNLRLGLSAEYAFTPNVVGVVTPLAYSFSPRGTGLNEDIDSLQRIDFMVGIGYRM
jgi:tetratricopeptide (TPR) repeat protein